MKLWFEGRGRPAGSPGNASIPTGRRVLSGNFLGVEQFIVAVDRVEFQVLYIFPGADDP